MSRAIIQRETAEGFPARHCPALARSEPIAVNTERSRQWHRPRNPQQYREVI
jgi:hypothetical protein